MIHIESTAVLITLFVPAVDSIWLTVGIGLVAAALIFRLVKQFVG